MSVVNQFSQGNAFDILIKNGWVIDGTGNPMYLADVAIKGDRIVEVGHIADAGAQLIIDASGKIVCPGFIDAHSHTDMTILCNPTAQSTVRQGITTEIVGNCGESYAPLSKTSQKRTFDSACEKTISQCGFGEFLNLISSLRTSNNLAWFVGHNSLREAAGITGIKISPEQSRTMESLVREAMDAGALGVSTGLEFEPGRSAATDEVIDLVKIVSQYDGYYASHIRNRDAGIQIAVDEFLKIVRCCNVRGQLSHFNVRNNTGAPERAWHKAVDTIEQYRREGLDILADMTPLTDGIGFATALLPQWVFSGERGQANDILSNPDMRKILRNECDRYWRFIHRGEWGRVRVQCSPAYPEINGRTFPEISAIWGKDPWDCYFDILAASWPEKEGIIFTAQLFTEEHLREAIGHPLFMLVVDGYSTRIDGKLSNMTRFPLHYMGMIYFLTYHVRECHTLTLEEAIRKMTSMPATHFRLKDRGLIRDGCMADIVVFDFKKLGSSSTLEQPFAYPEGIDHVLVNGVSVVRYGEHTGARPGRNLLRN